LRVIPVIDIMRGVVVHGVGGRRERYLPIDTRFSSTSDPVEVALGLISDFGFEELYVADLDAITKGELDSDTLSRLCSIDELKIMVDAGVKDASEAERLADIGVDVVIVGTETLTSLENIDFILDKVGGERVSASIDVRDGRVVSRCGELLGSNPAEAAKLLEGIGLRELILIDISRVGSEVGVELRLAQSVVESVDTPVLVGGGVSGLRDLLSLREIGAAGALASTALHRGRLSRRDVDAVRGWRGSFNL